MTYSFLHSSDRHLGKAFGGYPETIRNRLREARGLVIARLAEAARAVGVSDVLLAGDTFDAETPAPETLNHAMRAMAEEADILNQIPTIELTAAATILLGQQASC